VVVGNNLPFLLAAPRSLGYRGRVKSVLMRLHVLKPVRVISRKAAAMKPWLIVCVLGSLFCVGCGASSSPEGAFVHESAEAPGMPPPADRAPRADQEAFQVALEDGGVRAARKGADEKPGGGNAGAAPQQGQARPLPRKIIYNAEVRLVVDDMTRATQDLRFLIKEHDALVATSESGGSSGAPRQGFWRIRVPVERFDSFLEGLVKLGVPQKNRTDSQDVSEEYYDVQDRIKNKQLEQETFRGYLQDKKATSKLDEILSVEKELSRVRGELDQFEGRLRRLKDLTALATVSVTMQEIKDYVPPQAPTFGNQIGTTFSNSVNSLSAFGRGLLLVLVALAPWLPVLAVVVVPVWLVLRRSLSRSAFGGTHPPVLEAVAADPSDAPRRQPDNPPRT
jgi:hypothetical protein